jgi:hypothetical protein
VASLKELDANSEIALHYETDRYPPPVPRASYSLVVKVYGGHKPRLLECRMYVDARGRLRLRRES